MAEEVLSGTPVDVGKTKDPDVVVDVEPDDKYSKPLLGDEEVEKLAAEAPSDDEVTRYAKDAQRRLKSMHTATQEWRKRVIRANNDLAAATNLAQQLYSENQQLRRDSSRNEAAMYEQAIQRSDAKLESARQNLRAARHANDLDAETKAQEEIARYVSEGDRLRLLKPSASGTDGAAAADGAAPPAAPAPQPARPVVTAGTKAWVARNQWFDDPNEKGMRRYAMGVHNELAMQGITELTDPATYFGTIDREMRAMFPDKFKEHAEPAKPAGGRPVAVVGATRAASNANGNVNNGNGKPRHITLTESEIRIARNLDLTPEQYAAQLIKEGRR